MDLNNRKIVALELFSGIGGFHYAMRQVPGIVTEICGAADINTTANAAYRHNFPNTKHMQRNIESLTAAELEKLNVDLIWMSPPCQPFTRIGKYMDCDDTRTIPFLHVLKLIPQLKKKPSFILLENVKGFEMSNARTELVQVLADSGYNYQEFLLTPQQFGIPNSRLRYYIVAKLHPMVFDFPTSEKVMLTLPGLDRYADVSQCQNIAPLSEFLETLSDESVERYTVPDKVLLRFGKLLDIVDETSEHSCCFTKAYTHYAEGTGSVLHVNKKAMISDVYSACSNLKQDDPEILRLLHTLRLRYFTPREVANLLGFPPNFQFPTDVSVKQQYRLLGNSLNVKVVLEILKLCL